MPGPGDDRSQRLAASLRENLRRRKAQARDKRAAADREAAASDGAMSAPSVDPRGRRGSTAADGPPRDDSDAAAHAPSRSDREAAEPAQPDADGKAPPPKGGEPNRRRNRD